MLRQNRRKVIWGDIPDTLVNGATVAHFPITGLALKIHEYVPIIYLQLLFILGRIAMSKMSKLNCWEYKKCGRENGGTKIKELGTCPTSLNETLDGTHDGRHAGRSCWIVAGSMCGGTVQGTFAQKYENCKNCDFYNLVKKEEGFSFELAPTLLEKFNNRKI